MADTDAAPAKTSRAGRNLPAAIAVSLLLGGTVIHGKAVGVSRRMRDGEHEALSEGEAHHAKRILWKHCSALVGQAPLPSLARRWSTTPCAMRGCRQTPLQRRQRLPHRRQLRRPAPIPSRPARASLTPLTPSSTACSRPSSQ
jgi:hypothetical protein